MIATIEEDGRLAEIVARRVQSGPALAAARSAFEELYRRHARGLLAFLASRVARSELDDLHQEVWHRAWRHLPEGFHGGHFRGWLFQVARNALIDQARKRRPESLVGEEAVVDVRRDGPEDRLLERERMVALARCLERLDGVAAGLVRARLGGEDYEQICGRLGLTPARAHKVFHLAKAQLQDCVERAGA